MIEESPIGVTRDGRTTVRVHVQPRAAKRRCCGLHDGALKIAVTAPPLDGKANRAVGDYIAELFGISPKQVVLLGGAQSRKKMFGLEALSAGEASERLGRLLGCGEVSGRAER